MEPISETVLPLTTRISLADDESQGTTDAGGADSVAIADGGKLVAFVSSSTNMVPAPPTLTGAANLFLRDVENGETKLVSRDAAGNPAIHGVNHVDITPDGDFLVFQSKTRLTTTDHDEREDVYRYDIANETLSLVSLANDGSEGLTGSGYGDSTYPSISDDGRYVTFYSSLRYLVPADSAVDLDVFVRDLQNGSTTLITVPAAGTTANPKGLLPDISGDGNRIAFLSDSNNLVSQPDSNGTLYDLFLWTRSTSSIVRISHDEIGVQNTHASNNPSISGDGSRIAFNTQGKLVAGDTNNLPDTYVYFYPSGAVELASVSTTGVQQLGAGSQGKPTISHDGTKVAWSSWDSYGLMVGDTNSDPDAYVRDLKNDVTFRASVGEFGSQIDTASSYAEMSSDGEFVAFSTRDAAVAGDTNDRIDVFLNDTGLTRVSMDKLGQSLGLGKGIYYLNPTAAAGDPVNTLTGSFITSVSDLALPGVGIPFSLERAYNSADATGGPLGRGWSISYDTSLAVDGDEVTLHAEDGQQGRFTEQPDGSYVGDPGARASLTAVTGGFELVGRDRVTRAFNASGRLTTMTSPNGDSLSLSYSNGELASVTDTVGRVISFEHTGGRLTKVTLPDGRYVSYGYTNGLLTSVRDVRGNTTAYGYDAGERLTTVTDQNQHVMVTNTYGTNGRVTQQLDAVGKLTTFAWDAATGTSTMTDARNNQWKDIYRNNVLIERRDPLGNSTKYTYDPDLNLVAVTDASGYTTKMTYDDRGNLLTSKAPEPLAYTESFVYDAHDNVTSHTDGRGKTRTFGYDTAGNLTTVTEPGGIVTSFVRNVSRPSLVASTTGPRAKTTTFGYDVSGNLTTATTPSGSVWSFAYDAAGRRTSAVDPRGNVSGADPAQYRSTFEYDAANNLTSSTDPLGNETEWSFGPTGNLLTAKDARLHSTTYTYDDADRLKTVQPPGVTTPLTYVYDDVGNVVTRTDPEGDITSHTYDAGNRLTDTVDPSGSKWSYAYYPNGWLKSTTDANGNATVSPTSDGKTTYIYDPLGRTTKIDYSNVTPDATTADVTLTYDANGNRLTMAEDGGATTAYTYDDLNQVETITRGTRTFAYDYDDSGNITSREYPGGPAIAYSYNDDGFLDSLTADGGTTTFEYDEAGQLSDKLFPNGVVETTTYDAAMRPFRVETKEGVDVLDKTEYTLDAVGNPLTATDELGSVTHYGYNSRNMLEWWCEDPDGSVDCDVPGAGITLTYDDVGNRLEHQDAGTTVTYTYAPGSRLQQVEWGLDEQTYTYDSNGNVKKVEETGNSPRTFVFDMANRLKSTTQGTSTTAYSYDGDGVRTRRETGSAVTNFEWDANNGLPMLAREADGSWNEIRRYTYGNGLLSMRTGGANFFYHRDLLGSVSTFTSETGEAQWHYSYSPFGVGSQSIRTTIPTPPENPFRFAGEYRDTETGDYHLRARQYSPGTGRFSATDPAGSTGLMSPYAYADNQPTVLVDPSGWTACGRTSAGDSLYKIGDFFAGWGDTSTTIPFTNISLTSGVRSLLGVNDEVNKCSGSYSGGSWTSVVHSLALGKAGGVRGGGASGTTAAVSGSAKVRRAVDVGEEWLGPNARVITNEAGDKIFLSADGLRRIRTDINRPHPHTSPHAHVEELIDGKWKKSGPIYPTDVPPH